MIVHGNSLSPFVRKVIVFAHEKGMTLDNKVAFGRRDPEWMAMSPFGKIPAFEDGDYTLADSTAIVAYLEAKQPEPRLIPTEARACGRAHWYDEFADTVANPAMGPIFFHRVAAPLLGMPAEPAIADAAAADQFPAVAAYIDSMIPESGFLVEDRFTLADVSVGSVFVNALYAGLPIDGDNYPRLAAYLAAIHARPSFAAVLAKEARQLGR